MKTYALVLLLATTGAVLADEPQPPQSGIVSGRAHDLAKAAWRAERAAAEQQKAAPPAVSGKAP